MELIETGILNYRFKVRSETKTYTINFKKIQEEIAFISFNKDTYEDRKLLKINYGCYIERILFYFDTYLKPNKIVEDVIDVFDQNSKIPICKKSRMLNELFKKINIHKLTCNEKCNECCNCTEKEFENYKKYIEENNDLRSISPKKLIAFFLNVKNLSYIRNLNIPNILKVFEFTQLLKSSQSGTERVFNIVSRIVEHRFEGMYSNDNNLEDMVNVQVILRMGSDIKTLDSKLAAQYFIESGYVGTLMKNKPPQTQSKSIKTSLADKSKRKTSKMPDPEI